MNASTDLKLDGEFYSDPAIHGGSAVVGVQDHALHQQQAAAQAVWVLGPREQRETVPGILWEDCEFEKPEQFGRGVGGYDILNVCVKTECLFYRM